MKDNYKLVQYYFNSILLYSNFPTLGFLGPLPSPRGGGGESKPTKFDCQFLFLNPRIFKKYILHCITKRTCLQLSAKRPVSLVCINYISHSVNTTLNEAKGRCHSLTIVNKKTWILDIFPKSIRFYNLN